MTLRGSSTAARINLTWLESLLREGVHLKTVGQPCTDPAESTFSGEDMVISQCEGEEISSRPHDGFLHELFLIGIAEWAYHRVHGAVGVKGAIGAIRQELRTESTLGCLAQLETVWDKIPQNRRRRTPYANYERDSQRGISKISERSFLKW